MNGEQSNVWRQKLLNIILLFVIIVGALVEIANFMLFVSGRRETSTNPLAAIAFIIVGLVMYFINKKRFSHFVGIIFVLFFLIVVALAQPADEAFEGSNILALSIPLIMSTYLISSYASFAMGGLLIGTLFYLSYVAGEGFWGVYPSPNTIATVIIFTFASWAGGFATERALIQSREVNKKLKEKEKELRARLDELKIFEKAAVGRELRIAELKEQTKEKEV